MFKVALFLLITLMQDTIYVFYSPECPHCQKVIKILRQKYPSTPLKLLNLEEDSIMRRLDSLESVMKTHEDRIPVIFYKRRLYYGEIPGITLSTNKKEPQFPEEQTCRSCKPSEIKKTFTRGKVYYVYTPGCHECSRFSLKLKKLLQKSTIRVIKVSSFDSLGLAIIHTLKRKNMNVSPPFLVVGDTVLCKLPDDASKFQNIIKSHINGEFNIVGNPANLNLTLPATLIAGLIDGINPCAFTVLLFLIAFLSYKKKRKRDSLLILIFFSLGVFIAYFSIGLGLFWLLDLINRIKILSLILKTGIGLFAIILGILSFRDGVLILNGKSTGEMGLSLSEKQKTHSIIRKYIDRGVFAGSLLIGFSISFVEFACTGQVYLPTISYISRQEGLSFNSLSLLFLYNIAFLIPLFIIGLLAIFIEQKVVVKKLRQHTPYIRFATAFLFWGLGLLVMFS